MTRIGREVTFEESDVQRWCELSNDSKQIYLSDSAARDSVFGERIVPGVMIIDQVSGLLSQYGEVNGETVVLANIVAARFRDPVSLGETVEISIEEDDSDQRFTYFEFEARSDELKAHGTISAVIG